MIASCLFDANREERLFRKSSPMHIECRGYRFYAKLRIDVQAD
jgi:hypothetical protein